MQHYCRFVDERALRRATLGGPWRGLSRRLPWGLWLARRLRFLRSLGLGWPRPGLVFRHLADVLLHIVVGRRSLLLHRQYLLPVERHRQPIRDGESAARPAG